MAVLSDQPTSPTRTLPQEAWSAAFAGVLTLNKVKPTATDAPSSSSFFIFFPFRNCNE
ncbi:MAG: hypothetical protein QM529_04365 [Hydrotalea sp.]|nr:hypothetical protein [Hydrotalea sp.]